MRSTIVIGYTSRLYRDLGITRDESRRNVGGFVEAPDFGEDRARRHRGW